MLKYKVRSYFSITLPHFDGSGSVKMSSSVCRSHSCQF
jgi:hypothetical protein